MNARTPPPEPDENDLEDDLDDDFGDEMTTESLGGPPHPVNWNLLSAHDLEQEWLELNRWVDWLRHTYGLPAAVIPPFWHHHPELVWELSALHLHWLCAYDPEQKEPVCFCFTGYTGAQCETKVDAASTDAGSGGCGGGCAFGWVVFVGLLLSSGGLFVYHKRAIGDWGGGGGGGGGGAAGYNNL